MPFIGAVATFGVCGVFMLAYYLLVLRPRMAKMMKAVPEDGTSSGGITDTRSFSLKTKRAVAGITKCRVLYATVKGASKKFAEDAARTMTENGCTATAEKISEEGRSALLGNDPILFVLPTYEGGVPPAACTNLMVWLQSRVADGPKFDNKPRYTILGLGHSDYASSGCYNKACKDLHKLLRKLGARPFGPGVVLGDEGKNTQEAAYSEWIEGVVRGLKDVDNMANVGVYEVGTEEDETQSNPDNACSDEEEDVPDMEDMLDSTPVDPDAEMINPRMRRALTKQGYNLIGSHSGVKLCRWTKAQLRGRGGCYKHTFYGITSYECMEMTPSLACANKCVFCWRHHTNPVSKEWKWKTDDPDFLVSKAVEGQRAMIKPLKGVPGVMPERFEAAMNPSHCALSLVGEPIIYPEINTLVDKLHEREISSFMVTNAQFPEKIEELRPVTQLYISVDAATKESMKAIDRPIFEDFWDRFLRGVDAMRNKGQRTVFRLTLVKSWNVSEIENYAQLIQRGQPDFVEVKGVTWCGESTASNLTMSNVPFHKEVIEFCTQLADACGAQYELACEHEHSCCVLIANTKFKKADGWHTWIDFKGFHELVRQEKPFGTDDYLVRTPDWGQYGNAARGFDPEETRYVKVRNHPAKAQQ
eukprot:TRINITY_DN74281_c0_g1_i1.p1 TRINITY_DN74281_c0_g1~~TRINITY_DN74281_c0_g1_i1.p1  ORF type:complete len:671 (+),score=295.96 TRINITY_DN74281_c0_g1_i1:84-2015(+)